MAYGLPNGHVTDDVTWPWKVKLLTPIRLERNVSKTTWARDFKFGTQLLSGMPSGRTNNFPWKWAWPRSRDAYIFWNTIEHISKTTWATDFKFGKCAFDLSLLFIWLSGSAYYGLLWGSTVGYPSDSLASCWFRSANHCYISAIYRTMCEIVKRLSAG